MLYITVEVLGWMNNRYRAYEQPMGGGSTVHYTPDEGRTNEYDAILDIVLNLRVPSSAIHPQRVEEKAGVHTPPEPLR